MADEGRASLRMAGVMAAVVAVVVGGSVYGLVAESAGKAAIGVGDVEGAWIAEDDGDVRLVMRADGSAELEPKAQAEACAWVPAHDGRAAATWTFGDIDDPRVVHIEVRHPDTAERCYFDLDVAESGKRATVYGEQASPSVPTYVRGGTRAVTN
ncbi:hypothetical protein [Streptomyces sp. NPDC126499]|uniref:hypothetical protein n=1 Tax=Streptomyces sp. NPDC126499 TaxID=3155314 RepID=UPI0033171ADD